jgi:hypothetical protein
MVSPFGAWPLDILLNVVSSGRMTGYPEVMPRHKLSTTRARSRDGGSLAALNVERTQRSSLRIVHLGVHARSARRLLHLIELPSLFIELQLHLC